MESAILSNLNQVDEHSWDSLANAGNPFLSYQFLHGLEQSGCVAKEAGWEPYHLLLRAHGDHRSAALLGAVPAYIKYHSWGEYVFDWAWAEAYQYAGLRYYPKLLCAVPFTPVTGPRLLTSPAATDADVIRAALLNCLIDAVKSTEISSLHILFTNDVENRIFDHHGLMLRSGSQFHWQNADYENFDHYLAHFTAQKRKKIRRERRRILESGIEIEIVGGDQLTSAHWDHMYGFYQMTAAQHGAMAYLNRQFFEHLQHTMASRVIMVLAREGTGYVAGALYFRGDQALYGRYWGAREYYNSLHFETCYYQPIEYCIRNQLQTFEAGAQGEHKLSRGLLPNITHSAHWLPDRRLSDAVSDFLRRETAHVDRYAQVLHGHTPFRREL